MTDGKTAPGAQLAVSAKPTVESLGIDVSALDWQRSGTGDGAIEIARVGRAPAAAEWVLMRVCGDRVGDGFGDAADLQEVRPFHTLLGHFVDDEGDAGVGGDVAVLGAATHVEPGDVDRPQGAVVGEAERFHLR